ncbi:hypothetical protein BC832DRAFT_562936 [Gaertneriomyces semiglobifer]|nr:hypothetical protein BC832DRAFT_562936 [Gaertneriomyces semiglobifer]
MPRDYGMEGGMEVDTLMSPQTFTSADFPSEYDNGSDAFAENIDDYAQTRRPSRLGLAIDTSSSQYSLDAAPDISIISEVGISTAQPTIGKPDPSQLPRRVSLAVHGKPANSPTLIPVDPLRFPGGDITPTSPRDDTFATAAEGTGYAPSDLPQEIVIDDPTSVTPTGHPLEPTSSSADLHADISSLSNYLPQMSSQGPYNLSPLNPSNSEGEWVPDLRATLEQQRRERQQDEENDVDWEAVRPAYSEEAEDGWDVGVLREEHQPEFQDVSGLDTGDENVGRPDDDEGMDPAENL